ncbi:unnamed protein product [Camellia sinensis]
MASSPTHHHNLYFLQIHRSFSSSSIEATPNQPSFTVNYLINSCELPLEKALSLSKQVKFETPHKPDSVLALLENHGFTKTQISNLVMKFPRVLLCDPDKTLLPKLEFFKSKGISSTDVAKMLSSAPKVLDRSLRNQIVPSFNFYRNLIQSQDETILAIKRCCWLLLLDPEACVPNIEFLREVGFICLSKIYPKDMEAPAGGVENILVIGHSCCGGICALMSMQDDVNSSCELSELQSMLGHHTLVISAMNHFLECGKWIYYENDFVLDIFVEIGVGQMDHCENDFEADMLKDTADYYSRKASNWILEDSCPDYMLKVEECLKREKDRVAHYLHSSSELKLLEGHSGCHALLRDDKVDLSRMYRLFSKIPRGLNPVSSIFKQHVTAEGTALVKQAEDAASNKKADKKDVVGLQEQALKEAFEVFCNKGVGGSSSVELLATFCDNILKKGGSEKLSDETIEETLEKVVKLLAHISDKDLFTEFYRKKLARRLLFDKSVNEERSILTKLKQQCGGQFTSKMEGMVTDLTFARKNQTNFEEYLKTNPDASPGIDLTVTVLTTGFWPGYKSFDLNLPAEMVKCVQVFREFYQTKTKHRKLTWIYSLGTCNLNGKFEPKTMELIVTTYQIELPEIMTQLNLTDDDEVAKYNDAHDYLATRRAMDIVGISQKDQDAIFRVVAAILHLGNVEFTKGKEIDSSVLKDDKSKFHLQTATDLLMCDLGALEDALLKRVMITPEEVIRRSLDPVQATVSRDGLAKTIYYRLFDWDLQQHFNQMEQEEYTKEEINWSYIEFVDNQDVLDLIEKIGRLYDSNKNLIMATLSTIGAVTSAMGLAVEKSNKGILSDVLKCLGDNNKHMRESTLTILDAWLATVHLEK